MTLYTDISDAGRRAYLGIIRGTLTKAGDDPKMQELEIEHLFSDGAQKVEHWHGFGFSHVPLPPSQQGQGGQGGGAGQGGSQGQQQEQAEVLLAFLNGNPSHPVVIATGDRRHRPRNMKPGESSQHDDQGQAMTLGRDGLTVESPKKAVLQHYKKEDEQQGQQQSSGGRDMSKAVSPTASVTAEDGKVTIKVGSITFVMTKDGIDITGGYIKHNGKRIDHTHTHRDVMPGGGNTGVPNA